MARSEEVKTPLAIVSYANNLFEARENEENGQKSYGCTLLFKKGSDLSVIQNAAFSAAKEAWGDKAAEWLKNGVVKSPFLDGDGPQAISKKTGERAKGFAGHTFIRCKSGVDYKPKVFDKARNPVFEKAECPSGSHVYAVVNAFTWENAKNGKGITFGISLVQVVKKAEGEEVLGGGGGADPDKFFEKIEDTGDAPATGSAGAAALFGG